MKNTKIKSVISLMLILSFAGIFPSRPAHATTVSRLTPKDAATLADGNLIRGEDGIDVYIIKRKYKRHILNPDIFNMYGHLRWEDIREAQNSVLDLYTTSNLYRASGQEKVYTIGENGVKRWIEDRATFDTLKFFPDQIFEINSKEAEVYPEKPRIHNAEAQHLVRLAQAEAGAGASAGKLIEKIQEVALRPYDPTKIIATTQQVAAPVPQQATAQQATSTPITSTPAPSSDGGGGSGGGGGGGGGSPTPPAETTVLVCTRTPNIASGSQTYNVSSGGGQPQIQGVTINPLNIQVGTAQTISVTARDTNDNAITSMSATITTDSGSSTISLSLNSGTAKSGTWQGSWTATSAPCAIYTIRATATSASGTSNVTLAFL